MIVNALARSRGIASSIALERLAAYAFVVSSVFVFVGYWTVATVERWRNFETNAFDLGFFDQVIWNTAQGRLFDNTFIPYNFAGQHFEPVLLLFAAAYRFGGGPITLMVAQAALAGAAAFALFATARAVGLRASLAAAVMVGYLANPYLHRALTFDFHPEVLVAGPVFAGSWAASTRHTRLAIAAGLSLLLFKEDAAFVALALAAWCWWSGERRAALAIASAATLWVVLIVGWLMPHVRDGAPSDLVERYRSLIGPTGGASGLGWLVTHPLTPLAELLKPSRVAVAAQFLATSAGSAIAAPWSVLMLVPGLLLALLSTHPPQHGLMLHYAAELVPVAMLATVIGAGALARRQGTHTAIAVVFVLPLLGFLVVSPASPLAERRNPPPTETHRAAVLEALALVPAEASVSAQSGLVPRLSQRRQIREFPGGWETSAWVVVDAHGFRSRQSIEAGFDDALATARARLDVAYERDGVLVLREAGQP